VLHKRNRPLLESFGKHGVISVAESLLNDCIVLAACILQPTSGILTAPRIIPLQALDIDENPEKLRNGKSRVRIVEQQS
jgi:hypothetical protein